MFDKKYTARYCGHTTAAKGKVTAFGRTITTQMPVTDGTVDYCLHCLGQMAIRCGKCGEPIFVWEPITLSTYIDDTTEAPDFATTFQGKVIGCLNASCCASLQQHAGYWVPDIPNVWGRIQLQYATAPKADPTEPASLCGSPSA